MFVWSEIFEYPSRIALTTEVKHVDEFKIGQTAGWHEEAVAFIHFALSKTARKICAFVHPEKLLNGLNN